MAGEVPVVDKGLPRWNQSVDTLGAGKNIQVAGQILPEGRYGQLGIYQ